jgi:predicted ATPase
MNPRHADKEIRNNTDMLLQLRSMFSSHGEILQATFSTLRLPENTCLLLDEPESGQDFDHVLSLRSAMDRAVAHGIQIIVATHQFLFWERAHILELRRGYQKRVVDAVCRIKCGCPPR